MYLNGSQIHHNSFVNFNLTRKGDGERGGGRGCVYARRSGMSLEFCFTISRTALSPPYFVRIFALDVSFNLLIIYAPKPKCTCFWFFSNGICCVVWFPSRWIACSTRVAVDLIFISSNKMKER